MIGSQDHLVLLGIAIVVFGAKRLPEISRSLGQALAEFKKGMTGAASGTEGAADASPVKSEGSVQVSGKDDRRLNS